TDVDCERLRIGRVIAAAGNAATVPGNNAHRSRAAGVGRHSIGQGAVRRDCRLLAEQCRIVIGDLERDGLAIFNRGAVEWEGRDTEVIDPVIVIGSTGAAPEQRAVRADTRVAWDLAADGLPVIGKGYQTRRGNGDFGIHELVLAQVDAGAIIILRNVLEGQ